MSLDELKTYLKEERVRAQFFEFTDHTMTVHAAVNQFGITPEQIVKAMVFIDNERSPLLAIVPGDRRVSEKKLTQASGAQHVKRANPIQVEHHTGYAVGAVPPVGHKNPIKTFIDPKVMQHPVVIGGGGATNALLEISPTDIQRLTKAEIIDISV